MDNKINDSHDIISYLMILMNHKCSETMAKFENGIYRVTNKKELTINLDLIPLEIKNNIELILSNTGNYSLFNENLEHSSLNLSSYLHITSPIRRIVDLLNLIKLQENLKLIELGEESKNFYNYWIDKIDYINETFKSINKVQRDCSLLDLFYNNNEIKNKIYDGYIISKYDARTIGHKYNVYIHELKLFSTITVINEIIDFNNLKFKLFLFNDEDNIKRKIKLQLL
jgi:exoribonuclease R